MCIGNDPIGVRKLAEKFSGKFSRNLISIVYHFAIPIIMYFVQYTGCPKKT